MSESVGNERAKTASNKTLSVIHDSNVGTKCLRNKTFHFNHAISFGVFDLNHHCGGCNEWRAFN